MTQASVVEGTEFSLQETIETLTVAEVQAIERHYGRTLDGGQLSGTDLLVAVVWAMERRKATGKDRPDWTAFGDWTMKRLNEYFAPEPIELDPAAPETESGKGDTPGA